MVTTNAIAKKEEKERQKIKRKKTKAISHCRQRNNPWLPNILENITYLIKISFNQEICSICICSSGKIKPHHHMLLNQLALGAVTGTRGLRTSQLSTKGGAIALETAVSSSLAKQSKQYMTLIVDVGACT